MKVKAFKKWINELDGEFDEFEMVWRESLPTTLEDEDFMIKDTSVEVSSLDREHEELALFTMSSWEAFDAMLDERANSTEAE